MDYTKVGNKSGIHSSVLDGLYLTSEMTIINNRKIMVSEISKKQSTINLQEKYSAEIQQFISIATGMVSGAPLFFFLAKLISAQK